MGWCRHEAADTYIKISEVVKNIWYTMKRTSLTSWVDWQCTEAVSNKHPEYIPIAPASCFVCTKKRSLTPSEQAMPGAIDKTTMGECGSCIDRTNQPNTSLNPSGLPYQGAVVSFSGFCRYDTTGSHMGRCGHTCNTRPYCHASGLQDYEGEMPPKLMTTVPFSPS